MTFVMGKQTRVEMNGVDLSSYLADSPVELDAARAHLDGLYDASMQFTGWWEAGMGSRELTFVSPPWMLEPRFRKALALFLDPVGYHRRRRMHSAYHRRRR